MARLNKYKPYESYLNSSAVWYKQKPAHWECERFKHNFIEKKKRSAVHLPAGAISFGRVIYKSEENLSHDTKDSYQEVLAGEFLINPLNLNFDLKSLRTAISNIDVVVSTGYIVLQSRGLLHPPFARWLLHQFDVSHMKTLGSGVRQTINYADIGNSIFCRPSPEEQRTIAAFLDHETARIDNLIEKQQQLIELLKEKRQAVISHAVTKGLNPDVPVKDSGVEWLGKVPKHWNVKKFKYLCGSIISGPFGSSITKDMYVKSGYKVYGQEQVIPNDFNVGDYYISEADFKSLFRYSVNPGDILISCVGTFGKIAVFPEWAESGIINPRLIKATLNNEFNPVFIREFLKSETVFKQFELLSRGGTMGVINISILNEILISSPSYKEQCHIVSFTHEQKKMFQKLIERAVSQIELLQERRTALISAAVTGKIDVRNWVAPEAREAEVSQEATA